jgi:hypothetical protein
MQRSRFALTTGCGEGWLRVKQKKTRFIDGGDRGARCVRNPRASRSSVSQCWLVIRCRGRDRRTYSGVGSVRPPPALQIDRASVVHNVFIGLTLRDQPVRRPTAAVGLIVVPRDQRVLADGADLVGVYVASADGATEPRPVREADCRVGDGGLEQAGSTRWPARRFEHADVATACETAQVYPKNDGGAGDVHSVRLASSQESRSSVKRSVRRSQRAKASRRHA